MARRPDLRSVVNLVVASPGDVEKEREILRTVVVEDINRTFAPHFGFQLVWKGWETDADPGFNARGSQARIDEALGISILLSTSGFTRPACPRA